tara:strand:+ start:89443 stop:90051 length:609 start_codon:yes stop_codon:yes gene_type:complete
MVGMSLIFTFQAEAGGLGDILDTITNSKKKSKTIQYVHRTEDKKNCEKEGKRVAQERVIALCQQEFKKECKKMGKPSVLVPTEEVLAVPQTIEKYFQFDTNDKNGCEAHALKESRKLALLECQKNFGTNASCEVINAVITRPVTRTVHSSTFGGMFKKYKCTAKAIAQPQVNGNPVYACTVSASAKAKKGSWRDVLGDVLNN